MCAAAAPVVYNSADLESLAINRIVGCVDHVLDINRLGLPISLRDKVVQVFLNLREAKFRESLRCYEIPDWLDTELAAPLSPGFILTMRQHALDMWDWTVPTPLPADLYAFIMQLDNGYVSFFLENPTHFVSKRFIKTPPSGPEYCLCEPCFNRDMDYDRAIYTVEKTHSVWDIHSCMLYMKDAWNWCANCITTPLFKILSEEMCRNQYNLHTRIRSGMFWRFSTYHSDDDSDSDEFTSFRVQHPRIGVPL